MWSVLCLSLPSSFPLSPSFLLLLLPLSLLSSSHLSSPFLPSLLPLPPLSSPSLPSPLLPTHPLIALDFFISRAVARKVDVLLSSGGGGGGVDVTASPGAVPSSLTGDLAQIKATESNILHQLADLRWVGACS